MAVTHSQIQRRPAEVITGNQAYAVADSIKGLYYTLVDYGEARVKTDVDKVFKEWCTEQFEVKKIKSLPVPTIEKKRFQIIIQVLNKYGMLFDTQPKGYSNVSMKSV